MYNSTRVMSVSTVMLIILLLACVPSLYAQDGQRAKRFMQQFDQNQDGNVSRDEYPGPDDAFARLDANKDGIINETEVKSSLQRRGKSGGNFIAEFDADKDGKVSKKEFPRSAEQFAQLDTNGDGYITEDEAPSGQGRGGRGPGRGRRL